MSVLLFSREASGPEEKHEQIIESFVPKLKVETYRTMGSLLDRLHQPLLDINIAILFAGSREELLEIVSIKDLLSTLRIILVLPDNKRDTVSLGLRLQPRFVSYADSDFKDIGAVLGRMLGDSK